MQLIGQVSRLDLEVLGRENPNARDKYDYAWLRARLAVVAGPFKGEIEFGITVSELAELHRQIREIARTKGQVRFETMEGNWVYNVDFEPSGAAIVSGLVTQRASEGNSVQYEIGTDPITLEGFALGLGKVVYQYSGSTHA